MRRPRSFLPNQRSAGTEFTGGAEAQMNTPCPGFTLMIGQNRALLSLSGSAGQRGRDHDGLIDAPINISAFVAAGQRCPVTSEERSPLHHRRLHPNDFTARRTEREVRRREGRGTIA